MGGVISVLRIFSKRARMTVRALPKKTLTDFFIRPKETGVFQKLSETFRWKTAHFCRYGLFTDDCFFDNPQILEAVRRMPKWQQDERMWRIARALDLAAKRNILPKEEWTTQESEEHYLEKYLREVKFEDAEKQMWDPDECIHSKQ